MVNTRSKPPRHGDVSPDRRKDSSKMKPPLKRTISKSTFESKQSQSSSTRRKKGSRNSPTTSDTNRSKCSSSNTIEAVSKEVTWRTLLHNGVSFPPNYKPHGIPMKYNGEIVKLDPWAEEAASMFVNIDKKHYEKNSLFKQNFLRGFQRALKKDMSPAVKKIRAFDLCDFSLIQKHIKKFGMRYGEADLSRKTAYAIVNGEQQHVHNFEVPPPGIILYHEEKAGLIRDRVFPEDVTINIGEESPAPPIPIEGRTWGTVIHDRSKYWVACWMDTAYGDEEYAELTGQQVNKCKYGLGNPVSRFLEKINKL